jgi:hypothetical protein
MTTMLNHKQQFNAYISVKSEPNEHELVLFERAQKYIQKLAWIPGIEMIAVSNSLSMYATHPDSDIDLFIVTAPRMIWFVRFFVTLRLWIAWVWRHGDDIAENFCLSFFITTEAMNLEKIAIRNDIYLYCWIYYLKPILIRWSIYERFLEANSWVEVSEEQRIQNQEFRIQNSKWRKEVNSWGLGEGTVWVRWEHFTDERSAPSFSFPNGFGTFATKSTEILCLWINIFIRFFLLPRSINSYNKLGKPEWIIISDQMLKFHPKDRRESIRDAIVEKNFDK